MGWWLLHASFTETLSRNFYLQDNANPTTSTYLDLCAVHNDHNMSQFLSRVSRNCELLPRDIAAHTVAKDGRSWAEECAQWKVCTGIPLGHLANTWLGSRLTALGDVDIWLIFIKEFQRCHSIGDVHDWVTNRPLVELLVRPSLLWSTIMRDLLLL